MKIKFASSSRSPKSDKECLICPKSDKECQYLTSFLSYLDLFDM